MEIRQLKYFLAVADQRSFVSAASVLYISRQAVSKAVAQLEEELDVELFMRESGGAFLTPAGVLFYDRARSCVMEMEQLRQEMQAYGDRYRQRIRLVFSPGLLPLYENALERYASSQKNAEIVYTECPAAECEERLLSRTADVAITSLPGRDSLLAQRVLLRSPYGLLTASGVMPDSCPLGCMADTPELAGYLEALGKTPAYQGYDCHRLFSLVAQGRCAMLLPQCLKPAGLTLSPLENPPLFQIYSLRLQSVEQNMLYRTLLDELQLRVLDAQQGGIAP